MEHSVKNIGDNYENISQIRNDKNKFNSNDFFKFAKQNINKYSLIENDDDLFVNTWYSNSLINDYKLLLQKN